LLDRISEGKSCTQLRPRYITSLIPESIAEMNSKTSAEPAHTADLCVEQIAEITSGMVIDSLRRSNESQSIIFNGSYSKSRIQSICLLIDMICSSEKMISGQFSPVKKESTIESDQIRLLSLLGIIVEKSSTTQQLIYQPYYGFRTTLFFEKVGDVPTYTGFDVAAAIFNKQFLTKISSLDRLVRSVPLYSIMMCAPMEMLSMLLGDSFLTERRAMIEAIRRELHNGEMEFHELLRTLKKGAGASAKDISMFLKTACLVITLYDAEDKMKKRERSVYGGLLHNDVHNAQIKNQLLSLEPEILEHLCDTLGKDQLTFLEIIDTILPSSSDGEAKEVVTSPSEDPSVSRKLSVISAYLHEGLFRWCEKQCRAVATKFTKQLRKEYGTTEAFFRKALDTEEGRAITIVNLPQLERNAERTGFTPADLCCNLAGEHAFSWAMQCLTSDVVSSHQREGCNVSERVTSILRNAPSTNVVSQMMDSNYGNMRYFTDVLSTEENDDPVQSKMRSFVKHLHDTAVKSNSTHIIPTQDGRRISIQHTFGNFEYLVKSFFQIEEYSFLTTNAIENLYGELFTEPIFNDTPSHDPGSRVVNGLVTDLRRILDKSTLASIPLFVSFFVLRDIMPDNFNLFDTSDMTLYPDLRQQMQNSLAYYVDLINNNSFVEVVPFNSFNTSFKALLYKIQEWNTKCSQEAGTKRAILSFNDEKSIAQSILKSHLPYIFPNKEFHMGRSSVLLTRKAYETLRKHEAQAKYMAIIAIQRQFRRYKQRNAVFLNVKARLKSSTPAIANDDIISRQPVEPPSFHSPQVQETKQVRRESNATVVYPHLHEREPFDLNRPRARSVHFKIPNMQQANAPHASSAPPTSRGYSSSFIEYKKQLDQAMASKIRVLETISEPPKIVNESEIEELAEDVSEEDIVVQETQNIVTRNNSDYAETMMKTAKRPHKYGSYALRYLDRKRDEPKPRQDKVAKIARRSVYPRRVKSPVKIIKIEKKVAPVVNDERNKAAIRIQTAWRSYVMMKEAHYRRDRIRKRILAEKEREHSKMEMERRKLEQDWQKIEQEKRNVMSAREQMEDERRNAMSEYEHALKKIEEEKEKVTKVQQGEKKLREKKKLEQAREAAIKAEKLRRRIQLQQYQKEQRAAKLIQNTWREHNDRKFVWLSQQLQLAVIIIQQAYRQYRSRKSRKIEKKIIVAEQPDHSHVHRILSLSGYSSEEEKRSPRSSTSTPRSKVSLDSTISSTEALADEIVKKMDFISPQDVNTAPQEKVSYTSLLKSMYGGPAEQQKKEAPKQPVEDGTSHDHVPKKASSRRTSVGVDQDVIVHGRSPIHHIYEVDHHKTISVASPASEHVSRQLKFDSNTTIISDMKGITHDRMNETTSTVSTKSSSSSILSQLYAQHSSKAKEEKNLKLARAKQTVVPPQGRTGQYKIQPVPKGKKRILKKQHDSNAWDEWQTMVDTFQKEFVGGKV
jgi:hypothetical protein